MNGWDAETYVRTAEQAGDWLDENPKVLYPESEYAKQRKKPPGRTGPNRRHTREA